MGFTEAVNDSIYASLACLIIGLGYTPLGITRCRTVICIPPLHSCFISKYTNKFVIVKCTSFFSPFAIYWAPSLMTDFNPRRRVRGGVQRSAEAAWEAGCVGRHQDAESGLHREAEAGLPVRGQHHGTVWPSQCGPPGRSGDKRWESQLQNT